tara:strand:- start:832 stop:1239 length:408 start_codon:yes stop_codon:yes gene_type:complete
MAVFGDSMSEVPENLHYTKEHEWVKLEEGGIITVGITDYAQNALTDIVYIELPEDLENEIGEGEEFAIVESVKSASSIFAPLSGTIIEVNEELDDAPELMNESPYKEGWIVKMKLTNQDDVSSLISPEDYKKLIE